MSNNTREVGKQSTVIESHGTKVCTGIIVACGLLAAILDRSGSMIPQPWDTISAIAGWAYFAAWSLSFYPQVLSNWRRKSVVGLSFDFASTNVLGFFCLSIFYSAFFFNSHVRQEYRDLHHGSENSVRANDVFFALHALLITSFTVVQTFMYDRGNQKISKVCKGFLVISVAVIIVYGGVVLIFPESTSSLGYLYTLSYIKIIVTVSKYIPQALLNFRRKSTAGWSIGQVILDLTGGILSLFQLILEAVVLNDASLVTGDPVKLLLALLSLVYDSLLMTQHYILYPKRADQSQPSVRQPAEDEENLIRNRDSSAIVSGQNQTN